MKEDRRGKTQGINPVQDAAVTFDQAAVVLDPASVCASSFSMNLA
jgi:hypothetical protein